MSKALTQRELEAVMSDYVIKERIQLAYPNNYEVIEIPLKTVCRAINKVQNAKIKGGKEFKKYKKVLDDY